MTAGLSLGSSNSRGMANLVTIAQALRKIAKKEPEPDYRDLPDEKGFTYPGAGGRGANPRVQRAIEDFHELPDTAKRDLPLLWYLLGESGTPLYKMSKTDSEYTDKSPYKARCDNCTFAYRRVVPNVLICSQIRGELEGAGWCRLWEPYSKEETPVIASLARAQTGIRLLLAEEDEKRTVPPPIRKEKIQRPENKYKAWSKTKDQIETLKLRLNLIESPIKKALDTAQKSAEALGDPTIAKKAVVKFNRIFGSLLSPIEMIRGQIEPLISRMNQIEGRLNEEAEKIREQQRDLESDRISGGLGTDVRQRKLTQLDNEERALSATPQEAKEVFFGIRDILKMVKTGLRSLDPKSYQNALGAEMQKQGRSLLELEKTLERLQLSPTAQQRPEIAQKIQVIIRGGKAYMEGLKVLADPEFADRIENNVRRALEEDIPRLINAAKKMGLVYGAKLKAAHALKLAKILASLSTKGTPSARIISKKLRRATKRLTLLRYLSTTS